MNASITKSAVDMFSELDFSANMVKGSMVFKNMGYVVSSYNSGSCTVAKEF